MNCPCGNTSNQQYFKNGETDFRLCYNCSCVFRETFPSTDELEEIYRQAYSTENISDSRTNQESGDFAAKSYAVYLADRFISSTDKVLDYGAGSGALLDELRNLGCIGDGIEFSASARNFCLANRGFSLRANLDDIPDNFYQFISMIEVIEHLTDLTGTLNEIFRVLAPGGKLFLTTPSRTGLRARIENGNWREALKKFHLFLFNMDCLKFYLNRVGFSEIKRIKFSPPQKIGFKFLIYSRAIQSVGLSGTLCVLAQK